MKFLRKLGNFLFGGKTESTEKTVETQPVLNEVVKETAEVELITNRLADVASKPLEIVKEKKAKKTPVKKTESQAPKKAAKKTTEKKPTVKKPKKNDSK